MYAVHLPTEPEQFALGQNFLIRKQTLRKVLTKCKYPKWALDKVERKFLNKNWENSNTQRDPEKG